MEQNLKFGHKRLYLDGQLIEASNGKSYEVICPANEKPIATIAWAQKEDTERALESAQKGFETWSKLPLEERLHWIEKLRLKLLENGDLLRESIMYEMGKTWEGSEEDLTSITNSLKFYSEEIKQRHDIEIKDTEGTHEHRIISQPLGVVVAFLAYNFPLLNLGFKLGPALASGCSIILKPSEFSPLSAYIIGEICDEIRFPKGVITILCGDLNNVGIPLCESKIPRLITMIGSTETAQKLIEQSSRTSIKRYSMECGGNAPFIVFPDADLEVAITHGAALKTGNSGQICVAPNRFFIHEAVIDEFVTGIIDRFKRAKIGFGRENKPDMGPLTNRRSVEKVHGIVQEAIRQGGSVLYGGDPITGEGYYFQPTVIRLSNKKAEILQHEIFGPVAIIVPFSTQEEVLELANNTNAGLASYVYSMDEKKLTYFSEKLEFGEVHLNGLKFDIYLPHGGIKNSGIGVDCSTYALDDYLIKKRVTKAL
ncbi:aldehyde dehydrogenase family protein [Arenibacter sp. F20364]|uniref:aldehyde dehydrogenase family protein n=1 Tax=Arenibacter sp. F20364 TaxID=2926415 RepID=UPI001FF47306|nr:aldehyde dehydrogenase family protein [Arenibacter sp. F20364]MCK0189943.1 aldehyde dehydrogenase family protein [Arenibacter sp. F20364]